MRRCGFPKPAAGIRRQTPDSGSGRISVQHRKSASPTPEISVPNAGNLRPAPEIRVLSSETPRTKEEGRKI